MRSSPYLKQFSAPSANDGLSRVMPCPQGIHRTTHHYRQLLRGMVKHVPMREYLRQERNGLEMERRKGEGILSYLYYFFPAL